MKPKNLCERVIEYVWTLDLKELSQLKRYKIAEKFNINKNYLSEKFNKSTKMTVHEFIQIVKIKRVEELLKSRIDLTIERISEIIGIKKTHQFRKKFKKLNGLNPQKFRNLNKRWHFGILKYNI